ncbi:MAG: MFS transporter [Thermoanaerobaculia bacterium]|nr:MFS transporter [Thermoanaerobaculia bacterium]
MPAREPLFTARFIRLWSFTFITFLTAFQIFPTMPFRIMELGGSESQAGLFLAMYTWASAIAAPLTGTIADHVGRRRLLVVAGVAFIVFSSSYAVLTWFPALLVAACIHGIFWSGLLSAGGAIVTEIIPPSRRTEGLGYYGMAPTAAIAIAPLLGLWIYHRFDWTWLCVSMIAFSVVILLLALQVRGGQERSSHSFPPLRELVDWHVIITASALFVHAFGYGGITSYVAVLAVRNDIDPPSIFFVVFAIFVILTRIFVSPIGDRYGPKVILYPSILLVPVATAMLALTDTRGEMIAAAVLFGLGFGGLFPAFMTYVLTLSDPKRHGSTFGSMLFAMDTGIGFGSIGTGFLIEHYGFAAAFGVATVISVTSLPLFLMTSRLLIHPSRPARVAGKDTS